MSGTSACFCGSQDYTVFREGRFDRLGAADYEFSVARCRRCGLARTFPVPAADQYTVGGSSSTHDGTGDEDAYSAEVVEFIAARSTGRRLLDVGCNVGNLVAAATAAGFLAEGVEPDPVAAAEAQRLGRHVRGGYVTEVSQSYDVIVFNHVLEHVFDLRSALSHVRTVLAPEGRVFIFVPYYQGLAARAMGSRWMGWYPQQHVWQFTPRTLTRVVRESAGLEPISVTTAGVIEPPSRGAKGALKRGVRLLAAALGRGDHIEAVFGGAWQ
jgi:SAM-dependent methyltransferase